MPHLRILHIIDSLERGGAETLVVNTIEALHHQYPESEQFVVTLYREGELLPLVAGKATHAHLGLRRANVLAVVLRLRSLLKTWKIDIVHSHLLHATLISRLALPASVKLVSTYHSVFYEPTLVDYARKELLLDRLTYRSRYQTIFVSEAVQENICQAVGITKNFRVLVNFASPSFQPLYQYAEAASLRVVMVGNLSPVKNQEMAVKALAQLVDLPVTVDLYGEGVMRPQLEQLIQQTGAKINLKGSKAMTSSILAQYDLLLMTSHYEGMPVSLLEAMQTGLPSLLNDLPMLRETAGEGAVYYSYNSLEGLVAALRHLLDHKDLLQQCSEKALERVQSFSAAGYVQALMEIYRATGG